MTIWPCRHEQSPSHATPLLAQDSPKAAGKKDSDAEPTAESSPQRARSALKDKGERDSVASPRPHARATSKDLPHEFNSKPADARDSPRQRNKGSEHGNVRVPASASASAPSPFEPVQAASMPAPAGTRPAAPSPMPFEPAQAVVTSPPALPPQRSKQSPGSGSSSTSPPANKANVSPTSVSPPHGSSTPASASKTSPPPARCLASHVWCSNRLTAEMSQRFVDTCAHKRPNIVHTHATHLGIQSVRIRVCCAIVYSIAREWICQKLR
jgi:hypothetical protein